MAARTGATLYHHEHTRSTKSSDTVTSTRYRLWLSDDVTCGKCVSTRAGGRTGTCLLVREFICWDKDGVAEDTTYRYYFKRGAYQREFIPGESPFGRFGFGKVLCDWRQVWTSWCGEAWERVVDPEELKETLDLDFTVHGGKQTELVPLTADLGPTLGLRMQGPFAVWPSSADDIAEHLDHSDGTIET